MQYFAHEYGEQPSMKRGRRASYETHEPRVLEEKERWNVRSERGEGSACSATSHYIEDATTIVPTDDEEHDRHGDTDDDDPRLDVLQPGSPLRSLRGFPELVAGHIETIARLLQILQPLTAIHHFLHVIPHYVRYLLDLYLHASSTDIYGSHAFEGSTRIQKGIKLIERNRKLRLYEINVQLH